MYLRDSMAVLLDVGVEETRYVKELVAVATNALGHRDGVNLILCRASGYGRHVPELADDAEPATRDQLIRAAIRVIGSRGLRGSTLRAIAAEAGLTHGMIVHHFGTRDNLIRAALERAIALSLTGATVGDASGEFPRLGDHIAEVAEDADGVVAFERELLNEAARNPEYRPYAVAMWERFERAIAGQLAHRGVTDPAAVIVFGAAVDGLLRRHMDLQDDASLETALAMLNGLADGLVSGR